MVDVITRRDGGRMRPRKRRSER